MSMRGRRPLRGRPAAILKLWKQWVAVCCKQWCIIIYFRFLRFFRREWMLQLLSQLEGDQEKIASLCTEQKVASKWLPHAPVAHTGLQPHTSMMGLMAACGPSRLYGFCSN